MSIGHRFLGILAPAVAGVCLTAHPASAAGPPAGRIVSPLRTWSAADLARYDDSVVHVKLVEGSEAVLAGDRFVDPAHSDVAAVNAVLDGASVLSVQRTFAGDRVTLREWKARGEERSGVVGPDLSLWFDLRVGGGRVEMARILNALNACGAVEIAHPEGIPEPAVIGTHGMAVSAAPVSATARAAEGKRLTTPDFTWRQDYLRDPPTGLDAPAAWALPGGRGSGIRFVDVELAWTEDHEDFDTRRNFYIGGEEQNGGYEPHGTAVLGEIIGMPNLYGITGFAAQVDWGVEAIDLNLWPTVPQYFQEAIDQLRPGDVWLIELQMYPPGRDATPMEWLQVNYDVIWTGVWSGGVVCVEAGANGYQNLDDPSWEGVFDRNQRDSGAIMVAAGTPSGLVAEYFTNYGTRMDVHAWGSQITTTGYGDLYNGGTLQTRYTASFSGTSGASPMVVGSSLCLQGARKAALGAPLDPIALRALLHDTGTPHHDPAKEIGPRPDLGAAVDQMLHSVSVGEGGTDSAGGLRLLVAPNPVRAAGTVRFLLDGIAAGSDPRLAVFDAAGRQVRILGATGDPPVVEPTGRVRFLWDARDAAGRPAPAGVYYARAASGNRTETGRIVIVR